MSNISVRVGFDEERTIAASTFDGTLRTIGSPLEYNPAVIIFDNASNAEVPLIIIPNVVWKTFPAGETFVLDLRANHGVASNYTIDLGTQFFTNAATTAAASGSFRISIVYAR